MTQNQKSKSKITRETVPLQTRLKLWVKSAGRCEFNGCNEPVWRNNLTLSDGNFGEVVILSVQVKMAQEATKNRQTCKSNIPILC